MRNEFNLPIKLPSLKRNRSALTDDFHQSMLELIPQAALLVNKKNQTIALANSRLAELSAYTRTELTGLRLSSLFKNEDLGDTLGKEPSINTIFSNSDNQVSVKSLTLIQRNKKSIPVSVTTHEGEFTNYQSLILIQSKDNLQTDEQVRRIFWHRFSRLIASLWESDTQKAISLAMSVALQMTDGKTGVVYQSQDDHPELIKIHQVGESIPFPDVLPIQDLAHLNKPIRWNSGIRPISTLHRSTITSTYGYLITAPIGQLNAHIGLIGIAGDERLNKSESLYLIDFLGNILNVVLGFRAQLDKLNGEINSLNQQVTVHNLIQERISDGYIRLSTDLIIIELNQTAELMLGYTNSEASGEPVDSILIANQPLDNALLAAKEASPTYDLGNVRLFRRNGKSFLANVRVFPVIGQENLGDIIVFIQDLSEQEAMRRQAEEYEQRAILGDVTAIFAHEVRNPINNISTGLQLMSYNFDENDPNQESIQRMLQDCDRLDNLLNSVLTFSRPVDYEMEVLDISVLLNNLIKRVQPRLVKYNIQYNLKIEQNCPNIEGNLRALEQVFNNLIQNAVDAMKSSGGQLGIKVTMHNKHPTPPYIEITVADTGPGIPEELQERIFQPFITTKKHGTGLGLAISKRIITAHKGNITLSSFPGGTIFNVQIPTIDK